MTEDFLGQDFLRKPELRKIRGLFHHAKRGLEVGMETKLRATAKINQLKTAEGFHQMIYLLELLGIVAEAEDLNPICSEEYSLDLDATNLNRVKVVYDYIIQHFQEEIKIKTVAELLNLTEVAFYKFIRRHTKKTFISILNEFRISYASKLLISSDKSISQICFESGFNNASYFNRKFKEVMNQTPHEFRNHYKSRNPNRK